MKILLVEPGYGKYPAVAWSPWGKMQLAAYLRKHGKYDVRIMDHAHWHGTNGQIRDTILHENPDVIGIGGMTLQRHDTLRIARVVRDTYGIDKRPLMVAGGIHFTVCPEDGQEYFDVIVRGEGEKTMLEVCQHYESHHKKCGVESFRGIKGAVYKGYEEWLDNGPRELLPAEDICAPAFDLVPWLARYDDGFITGRHVPMLMTGRGCPFDCAFCGVNSMWHRKVRMFPIDMVKEIMLQQEKIYGFRAWRVMDDTFAVSQERVSEFCNMTLSTFGPVEMACLTHCNTTTSRMLDTMKNAGFWVVAYGVESGNNDILKLINKGITIEKAAQAFDITHKAGIAVEGLFMMGNMGETEQTCLDTIKFATTSNHPSLFKYRGAPNWFQFATPFPGSKFHREFDKYGTLLTNDYNRYTHQEPVFVPHGMTADQLIKLRERAFKEAR